MTKLTNADRELLTLAAIAGNIHYDPTARYDFGLAAALNPRDQGDITIWNPLEKMDQALNLLIRIRGGLKVTDFSATVDCGSVRMAQGITRLKGLNEITCRVIVMVAAETTRRQA